jgi:lipid II:glycine glycyltransferase (peptidoglycan interpeptide bridge formation enzyme)
VIYTIWEPVDKKAVVYCQNAGFRKTKSSYVPSKTLVVDLKKGKEKLWGELSKDARRMVKRAGGMKVVRINRPRQRWEFWKQWKKTKKGYIPSYRELEDLAKSFGRKGWVMEVVADGIVLGGCIVLVSDEVAYYYFAWTSKEGRERGAQYKLVWEAIVSAKLAGLKRWDFEGIEDDRSPRKSWRGFSVFKKKFGGKEVSYPGCYVKWG